MTDDDERCHCPICGEVIATVTVDGPGGATLHPCGHTVDPNHPILD